MVELGPGEISEFSKASRPRELVEPETVGTGMSSLLKSRPQLSRMDYHVLCIRRGFLEEKL